MIAEGILTSEHLKTPELEAVLGRKLFLPPLQGGIEWPQTRRFTSGYFLSAAPPLKNAGVGAGGIMFVTARPEP